MAARYCDQCGTRLPPVQAAVNGANGNSTNIALTASDARPTVTTAALRAVTDGAVADVRSRDGVSGESAVATPVVDAGVEGATNGEGSPPSGAETETAPTQGARAVTALFADLADYTRMLADHEPQAVRARVESALGLLDETVSRFGGRRQPQIGDTVFALFESRDEGDDARALLCALEMRDAVAELTADGDEPLGIRIALATDEAHAINSGVEGNGAAGAVPGSAIAIAAGLQMLASPGEILADKTTVEIANGRLASHERGATWLRGRPAPIRVHSVIGEAVHSGSVGGRLVGRVNERKQLAALLSTARRTRRGGVAIVIGDAGVGKSRLIADLAVEARNAGMRWTWTENVSYGAGEPYRLVRALVQAIAADEGTEPGPLARRVMFGGALDPRAAGRVADAIAAIARDASANDWRSEGLLPPTNIAAAASITDAATTFVARVIELRGPRAIVVDDVQWADPASQPLLERLVALASSTPLVVIAAARPGTLPVWTQGNDVERIELAGLGPDETRELAGEVAGAEMGRPDAHAIYERTRGNPLFVDQIVRALLDDGSLANKRGRAEFTAERGPEILPLTLRSLLAARIELLAEPAREVLGVASVVGVSFDTDVVTALVGRPPRQTVLDALVDAGMIVPGPGHGAWRFAHPLIRETAHAGLATPRRRTLHARLADRIEAGARPGISRAARHRAAGGDVERAVPMLDRAARDALALGATAEAAEFWRAATRLVGDFDPRSAEFRRLTLQAQHATASGDPQEKPQAQQRDGHAETETSTTSRPPILFDPPAG